MSLRVVIVDDSAEFLRVARSLLERQGITVVRLQASSMPGPARRG